MEGPSTTIGENMNVRTKKATVNATRITLIQSNNSLCRFFINLPPIRVKGKYILILNYSHTTGQLLIALITNYYKSSKSSRRELLTPDLSHHRTYRSVYGGSFKIVDVKFHNVLISFGALGNSNRSSQGFCVVLDY